jgi:hypothetical protein
MHAAALLVDTLRYKPEGRRFDADEVLVPFHRHKYFRPHYVSEVDSASNRNEFQDYLLGVKATATLG